jgi:hypothetical protein
MEDGHWRILGSIYLILLVIEFYIAYLLRKKLYKDITLPKVMLSIVFVWFLLGFNVILSGLIAIYIIEPILKLFPITV